MEIIPEVKSFLIETTKDLTGSVRRLFMARAVKALDKGGQMTQIHLPAGSKIIYEP